MSGKFISFEGLDGSGKSTQAKLLNQYLNGIDISSILTREPGGTLEAEAIREFTIKGEWGAQTEMLLMYAARSEHINTLIKPMLGRGYWVVSDRYADSSIAYQGSEMGILPIYDVHKALGLPWPDLTFWLDIDYETAKTRTTARGEQNRFDQMDEDRFNKIRSIYSLIAMEDRRVIRIDASKSLEDIQLEIQNQIQTNLLAS